MKSENIMVNCKKMNKEVFIVLAEILDIIMVRY